MFYKLLKLGMKGKMLKVLKSMYDNVKSCIRTPKGITEFFDSTFGVQQGSVLSPLLFNLFIDVIGEILHSGFYSGVYVGLLKLLYLLFADDLIITSSHVVGLQRQLNKLCVYCKRWKLKVNASKTKIIVFRNGGRLKHYEKWYLDGKQIETVSYLNYLGLLFSCSGLWTKAQKNLADQGKKAMYSIKKYLCKFKDLDINIALKIFDCKILPILMYGCEVWGFHEGEEVEKVHISFCKYILQIGHTSCNAAVLGELGRHCLRTFRLPRIIKYWIKLIHSDNNRYVKQCYNYQFEMAEKGYNCWAKKVKDYLFSFGYGIVWELQSVGNELIFLREFKQRCLDIGAQQWNIDLQTYSKLDSYRLFKNNLIIEDYLRIINVDIFRRALCKFRVSNHNLCVESGRAENIPRAQRLCFMCNLNQVETEFHFCLVCPAYRHLRTKFLPTYCWELPSVVKFSRLLKSNHPNILIGLSKFIFYAFKQRENVCNNNK